jgi:hypothetical protein
MISAATAPVAIVQSTVSASWRSVKTESGLGFWLGVYAALWRRYPSFQLLPMNAGRGIGARR